MKVGTNFPRYKGLLNPATATAETGRAFIHIGSRTNRTQKSNSTPVTVSTTDIEMGICEAFQDVATDRDADHYR